MAENFVCEKCGYHKFGNTSCDRCLELEHKANQNRREEERLALDKRDIDSVIAHRELVDKTNEVYRDYTKIHSERTAEMNRLINEQNEIFSRIALAIEKLGK